MSSASQKKPGQYQLLEMTQNNFPVSVLYLAMAMNSHLYAISLQCPVDRKVLIFNIDLVRN